jgi:hypothetical protein
MKSTSFRLVGVARDLALLVAAMTLAGCASNPLPPPVITSLNPSSATAGSSSFTLKVIGTGFQNTDVVLWNGVALATQPVSSTELDAQVPGTLIKSAVKTKAALRLVSEGKPSAQVTANQGAADASASVNVFRKLPGTLESNTMTFAITSGGTTPDFSISAAPSSQTVTAGQNTTYSVTVGALNGFTGNVTLSVSGLPTGATGSFAPASVAGSGTSTLTVSTTSSTPAGTYTLTITGTSGSLTHSTTVSLVVNPAATPNFSISGSPSSQTVTAGQNTTYSVTVGALNGFTGAVTLSVSGLPTGASGSFTPTSVDGSGTSTLAVSTASSTPAGTYTVTITGTSGTLTHSATVSFVVNAPPDFSISASPGSQTVTAGQSTTYSVTVGALNGFTGSVTLSASGFPSGASGNFAPTSVTGSGSSTLAVTTASNTPAGTYTLTITGTSGTLTHSTTVSLVVNAAATGLTINVIGPGNVPGNSNANVVVKFGNSGSSGLAGVNVAITGVPNTVSVVSINLIGAPGSCNITALTCTLTGMLASGSDPAVVLTFQAGPGAPSFTLTATVSATGTASASGSVTTTMLNCVPQPGVLCGHYAMFVQGYTSAGPRTIAASFTADGANHITSGILDINSMGAPAVGIPILAASPTAYSFDANRLGNLTLNTSAGTFVFKFALDPTVGTFGSVIEYEPSGTSSGSGFLQLQAPAYHQVLITGSYGLAVIGGLGGASSGIRLGMLEALTANGTCGFAASGPTGIINNAGTVSRSTNFSGALNPSGACTVDATTGRGTGTFSSINATPAPSFSSVNFAFYIFDTNADGTANHMVMVSTDQSSATQPLLSGIVGSQHNAPYSTNAALDCARGTNLGCVFAFAGATGGNSLTGNSYVLAGLASITTQSNTAGAFSLLRNENNGGTVASGTITATYRYNSDGTGSYTPATGEVIDFILTDIDVGFTLSEGSNVSYGFFAPESSPFGPFNPNGLATKSFYAGTRFLGTANAATSVALSTVTQVPSGTNTGTFSGSTAFWNSTTNQNSAVLTGSYTSDTLTTRVTGTTNILGAASFAAYQLSTNQFVLIGTTNSDTGAVLMVF